MIHRFRGIARNLFWEGFEIRKQFILNICCTIFGSEGNHAAKINYVPKYMFLSKIFDSVSNWSVTDYRRYIPPEISFFLSWFLSVIPAISRYSFLQRFVQILIDFLRVFLEVFSNFFFLKYTTWKFLRKFSRISC